MPRYFLALAVFFLAATGHAQSKKAQDFGFRHLNLVFEQDPVNVLILSQEGSEQQQKPLFFYIQGDLPIPLLIYDEQGSYGTFPFNTDELLQHYHLAIVGKPFVPLVARVEQLEDDFTYLDPDTGAFPEEYRQRNHPDYYLARNRYVLEQLKAQPWISAQQLVVAGHAQGSILAAQLAAHAPDVTHLIYSSGIPFGTPNDSVLLPAVAYERLSNTEGDSLPLSLTDSLPSINADSNTPLELLQQLAIPMLVVWGSEGANAPAHERLRQQIHQQQNDAVTFVVFDGLTDGYFGLAVDGGVDYNSYHWDKVAQTWLDWLLAIKQK